MKKTTALTIIALAVSACDPYADPPGGTPSITYVTLLGAGLDELGPDFTFDTDARSGGAILIVKANVLLAGASVEAVPQTCAEANNWLTVTGDAGLAAGSWYTCYYPSTATGSEPGGAVWIYHTATQAVPPTDPLYATPDPADGDALDASDFVFNGTVQVDGGGDLLIATTASVGLVTVTPATGTTTPGGAAVPLAAAAVNRTGAATTWEIVDAVVSAHTGTTVNDGDTVPAAGRGTLAGSPGAAATYTPPATLDTGITAIEVTVRATNRVAAHESVITVAIP